MRNVGTRTATWRRSPWRANDSSGGVPGRLPGVIDTWGSARKRASVRRVPTPGWPRLAMHTNSSWNSLRQMVAAPPARLGPNARSTWPPSSAPLTSEPLLTAAMSTLGALARIRARSAGRSIAWP